MYGLHLYDFRLQVYVPHTNMQPMPTFGIYVVAWLAGLLACCSVLHIWFTTTIGVEIAILFRDVLKVEWLKDAKLETMNRQDFTVCLIGCELRGQLSRRLVHILGCPGCLSVHVSFWLACLDAVLLRRYVGYEPAVQDHAIYVLVCLLTWPWLACHLTRTPSKS